MTPRPATVTDVEALLELKREVFPNAASLEAERRRWEWQSTNNPFASDRIPSALVAEDEQGITGYFAFVPMAVDLGPRTGLGADGVDLCLHARGRGRGLARRLVEPMWSPGFCDFPFATGLNAASRHLFSAYGGIVVGGPDETAGFAYFTNDVHPERPTGLATEAIDGFESDASELWDLAVRPTARVAIRRDATYLNWRYRDHPFRPPTMIRAKEGCGRSRGFAVLQPDPELDRAYLLELLAEPGDGEAFGGLLRAAVEWADASELGTLYYATRDGRQHRALAAADLRAVPGEVPNFIAKLHSEDEVRVRDWWVSLGDGDQLYSVGDRS